MMATQVKRLKENEEVALPAIEDYSTTINDLPLECLLHILSFLPSEGVVRSKEVCSLWRGLESDIWRYVRKLDLIALEKLANPSSFMYLKGYMPSDLFFKYMHERFTFQYPRLLSLSGKFVPILTIPVPCSFDILRIATDECQNLEKVIVRFENFTEKSRQRRDLGELFVKNKKTLRSVTIDHMGPEFFNYTDCLLHLSEQLTELQLWGYRARYARFEEAEVYTRFFHRFVPAIERLKKLQVLVLNGIDITGDQLTMLEKFHDLRHLQIFRCSQRGSIPFDIEAISSRSKLEYLSLQRVDNMNTRWFGNLVRNNPNLKHLKLQTCTLKLEFIVQLFPLSKLETLSLTYLTLRPHSINLGGFHNLKKFVCTTVADRAVMELMDIAPALNLVNLRLSEWITPRILDKAHQITTNRTNNVPLHIIVEDVVVMRWMKPERVSPLLTVENSSDYTDRTRYGCDEVNTEELCYFDEL